MCLELFTPNSEKYVSARACSISEENESAYINAVNEHELGYY